MSGPENKLAWKRPISRSYLYNLDVGENYYMPMTTYLDNKKQLDTPGALCFRYVNRFKFGNFKILLFGK